MTEKLEHTHGVGGLEPCDSCDILRLRDMARQEGWPPREAIARNLALVDRIATRLAESTRAPVGGLTSDERTELNKFRRKQAIRMASGIDVNGRTFSGAFGWCSHQELLTRPCDECEALVKEAVEKWGHP